MPNIRKLTVDNITYDIQDTVSGYTTNTGTVTGMTTTAGTHTAGTQTVSGGVITTKVPTATSHLTNDSNFVSDANYVHTDNNFTDAYQTKLAGIAAGAEVNVQSDWNVSDSASDAYIKNKPTIPSPGTGTSYPVMDGTRALGTQSGYARVDHVHPSDTSRVPTTRTINGKALSSDITIDATEITGYTDAQTHQAVSVSSWIQNVQQAVDNRVEDVKLDGTSIVDGARVANISSQDILAGLQIEAQDVGFQAPVQTSYLGNASDVEEALLALDTAASSKPSYWADEINFNNDQRVQLLEGCTDVDSALIALGQTGEDFLSHSHGYITNGGAIGTAVTIASGDKLVISDESDSKVAKSTIAFGSSTTQFLANNGTWQTVSTEDTKVTNTLATTTKYYVTGTTSSSTNTGTQSFDSGIYATTTAGQLNATTYKVNEQVTLQWNSTDSSLDFVFA